MNLTDDPRAPKVVAALILAGLLLFGASLNDPFHFDDVLITNDANIRNPAGWSHFLNPFHLRQLTFFTFYLNQQIGGGDPAGYHLVNVALHIGNAILLFILLRMFFDPWVAIVAAALFLVHPIQTEPVLYVYQRSVLLACLFSLLALIALARRRHRLAVVCFFLAFESKESAIAVPMVVAMLYGSRLWQNSPSKLGGDLRARFLFLGIAIVLGVAAIGLLFYWNEQTVGIGAADQINPLRYFLAETRVAYTYLRLLIFPYPQSLEYEFPVSVGVLPIVGIGAILAAAWLLLKRERWALPGLCILSFFLLLAPTSSFIPSTDPAFEHRLYLPMLAFALFTAYILSLMPARTWITAVVLCILSVLTIQRGTVWSSDVTLWEDTVRHAPGKARVWFNLGGAYLQTHPEKARAALLKALVLQPDFVEALYDLGALEQTKGNWAMALAYYGRAVEKQPDYWPAWNNMGNTLFAMGQRDRSLEYFERTLSLNRDYWPAQYNIAIAYFMAGRYTDALTKLRIVLDWRPDFREARYLQAVSLTRVGKREAADEEWKKLGQVPAAESRFTPTMILAPNRP